MGYIVIDYSIPPRERIKVGYRRYHSGSPFVYLSRLLYPTESPYTITGLAEGTYEIEVTAYKSSCGGLCGNPQSIIAQTQSSSITSTTTINHGSTSTTTTTTKILNPVTVQWDIFSTQPDLQNSTLTKSITISSGTNYTIPTSTTSGLYWYVVKEPSSEPVKEIWYNTEVNQGDIPDQVWGPVRIINSNRYYTTRGLASFNIHEDLQFRK